MRFIELGPDVRVTRYFPYETSQAVGVLFRIPRQHGDHLHDFWRTLAEAIGKTPDNKQAFELTHKNEQRIYVTFWDGMVTFSTGLIEFLDRVDKSFEKTVTHGVVNTPSDVSEESAWSHSVADLFRDGYLDGLFNSTQRERKYAAWVHNDAYTAGKKLGKKIREGEQEGGTFVVIIGEDPNHRQDYGDPEVYGPFTEQQANSIALNLKKDMPDLFVQVLPLQPSVESHGGTQEGK